MAAIQIRAWQAVRVGAPMERAERRLDTAALDDGDVVVRVAGCGVCHTDLGFLDDGVRPGKPFPLTLGHEIAGVVEAAGASFRTLAGQAVVVPAVIPCGA